jgi:hypothetical protein
MNCKWRALIFANKSVELWQLKPRQNRMPQPESFAKCACQHCGGRIEFPVHAAGQKICCPHCDKSTFLFLRQTAPVEIGGGRAARKRIYLVCTMAAGVAALAGVGTYLYFGCKNSQPPASSAIRPLQVSNASPVALAPVAPPKPKPPPDPWHGLKPGEVTLEKTGDGRLVYAVGTLTNATMHQRFGVKVELDVLDDERNKIGSATDYADVIEPGKAWKFRAMVTDKTATSAKLANVKEQE